MSEEKEKGAKKIKEKSQVDIESEPKNVIHNGACHCIKIQWEVEASDHIQVFHCNCSICKKKQNHVFIVPKRNFKLLQGDGYLTKYTFNTGQAKHKFCSICGVQSFHIPRSNPNGIAVVANCIDSDTVKKLTFREFDGVNYDQALADYPTIAHLSI